VETRNAYRVLARKNKGKQPLGRKTCKEKHNIKMDLEKLRWLGKEWISQVQERVKF